MCLGPISAYAWPAQVYDQDGAFRLEDLFVARGLVTSNRFSQIGNGFLNQRGVMRAILSHFGPSGSTVVSAWIGIRRVCFACQLANT